MLLTSGRLRSRKTSRKGLKIALAFCAVAAIPLIAALYGSAARGLNPLIAWSCTSDSRGGLQNVSGWNLEIEHTSCQILAKHETISVLASPYRGPQSHSGWFRKRTLVFRYEPASADDLPPSFSSPGPGRILISVPAVSSISVQNHTLGSTAVHYRIGRISNPDPTGLSQAQ